MPHGLLGGTTSNALAKELRPHNRHHCHITAVLSCVCTVPDCQHSQAPHHCLHGRLLAMPQYLAIKPIHISSVCGSYCATCKMSTRFKLLSEYSKLLKYKPNKVEGSKVSGLGPDHQNQQVKPLLSSITGTAVLPYCNQHDVRHITLSSTCTAASNCTPSTGMYCLY